MLKRHTPTAVAPPFSPYSHGIEVPPNARWLFLSGQVGVAPDGTTSADPRVQNEQAWANISEILASAGMGIEDIVRIDAYLTSPDVVPAFRDVRGEVIGDARPASTLLIVAGLAAPDWCVEIEIVAAKV